jgi:tripeptide aminopeptidase
MTQSSRSITPETGNAQPEISQLASRLEVRAALDWIRAHEAQFVRWQLDLAAIPAPPFGESARSRWMESKFQELSLEDVHSDDVGNVFGCVGNRLPASTHYTSLSAHLDTVFPAGTPLNVRQ